MKTKATKNGKPSLTTKQKAERKWKREMNAKIAESRIARGLPAKPTAEEKAEERKQRLLYRQRAKEEAKLKKEGRYFGLRYCGQLEQEWTITLTEEAKTSGWTPEKVLEEMSKYDEESELDKLDMHGAFEGEQHDLKDTTGTVIGTWKFSNEISLDEGEFDLSE